MAANCPVKGLIFFISHWYECNEPLYMIESSNFSTERQLQSSKSRGEDRIPLDKSESWLVNHCTSHEMWVTISIGKVDKSLSWKTISCYASSHHENHENSWLKILNV